MSRQIDLTKPLSDEDRAYLEARSMLREIAEADGQDFSSLPDDSIHGAYGSVPNAVNPATSAANVVMGDDGTPVNPDGSAATVAGSADPGSTEPGDNYDDEDAWSYADIQAEAKERKEALGDTYDGPALNASRFELVSWLRSNDAATAS